MHLPWKVDSYISGCLLVVVANAVAIIGLLATRRPLRRLAMISHHEVGGFLLSVIGTMYAVILGLIVVDSLAKFQSGREMTAGETNALANIVLLSHHYSPEQRERVQSLALSYSDIVMKEEWELLDDGLLSSRAQATAIRLIYAVSDFEPKTGREQAVYEASLDAVSDFWDNRRIRVVTASQGVPRVEWFVLVIGGLIVVAFTYFFRVDHLRIQVAMTSLVATIIALNLYLVLAFGYPFSGYVKVSNESFNITEVILLHQDPASSSGVGEAPH